MRSRNKTPTNHQAALDPLTTAMNLYQQGKLQESETLFKRILTVAPGNNVALYSLTLLLLNSKRYDEAIQFAVSGTTSNPDFAPLWLIRAASHKELHQIEDALACYDKAIELNPKYIEALINSGAILRDLHRHKESLERFRRVLDIDPNYESALGNYGILLTEFKLLPEAISVFERLLAINPDYPFGPGLLTYERMHICDWTDLEKDTALITDGIHAGKKTCKTLGYMALSDAADDHYQCAKIFAAAQFPNRYPPMWNGEKYVHERIRIAYISPDLREHPVGHLMAGVMENHDRSRYEIICVSIGVDDNSSLRARFIAASDRFIVAKDMPSPQIARLLRELEVDIAVDLAGYTTDSRTDVFLHRPAPVQVNYLGYPGTMALECYDYIIADRTVLPPEQAIHYSEKPAYLDYCYLPIASGVEVAEPLPRSEYGLPERGFVFCAFSHDYKVHPKVFDIWMRLLHAHPGSVFWLMSRNDVTRQNLRDQAQARGIDPQRLVFASRVPRIEDHLARYRVADLFLDTWPYNAHTTAADALLSGLPVVTYKGQSFPSRVAASLLESLDLPELATDSFETYFEKANTLAREPARLQALRERLTPQQLKAHPFFGASFTHRLEALFDDINTCEVIEPAGGRVVPARQTAALAAPPQVRIAPPAAGSDLQEALVCFQKGNYPQAEIFARDCLAAEPLNQHALQLLGQIGARFGMDEGFRLSENIPRGATSPRFMLIKAWGYGFWSDVHHVLTQLLVAELTQRQPIVLWGKNCLFRRASDADAFGHFFRPVSAANLDQVPITASIYPPKWNALNLLEEDVNKWTGPHSRIAAQQLFARDETLVVSDFYATLHSIMPWIDSSSAYFGKTEEAIYEELFQKYLKPVPRLQFLIDDFHRRHMQGRPWVAVHMRGSDKVAESPHLAQTNAAYAPYVKRIVELNPEIGVFLLTDSQLILDEFKASYGERVLSTSASRSATSTGVHMSGGDGHSLGDEVVLDAYLAARCDYFVGNVESNVSVAIASLKSWPNGFSFLLGQKNVRGKNVFLHRNM
jgi:predicted O-linked N-acetylglucosamine transferase (SPINDLY family)